MISLAILSRTVVNCPAAATPSSRAKRQASAQECGDLHATPSKLKQVPCIQGFKTLVGFCGILSEVEAHVL
jgi:hypothetical protein